MHSRLPLALLFLLSLVPFMAAAEAADFAPEPPMLLSRSAILIDMSTGQVLYEKDADLEIPPASMTKLMTLQVIYRLISIGQIGYDDIVPVSSAADWRNLPGMSSNMRLESGQHITLEELMLGLSVSSGNDAAVALAEYAAGSVAAFVEMMNREAALLGLDRLHFADPSGLSAENMVTAREFAEFCRIYIDMNPQALLELHSVPEFTYPKSHNGPSSLKKPKTKQNTNLLIGRFEGIDGLKTGYIDESGYNITVTAEKGGRRLLAVLLGAPGSLVGIDGLVNRTVDAARILDYGYYAFASVTPPEPVLPVLPVYFGSQNALDVHLAPVQAVSVPTWLAAGLEWRLDLPEGVIGPIAEGVEIGTARLVSGDHEIFSFSLTTGNSVEEAGFWGNLIDSVKFLFRDRSLYFQSR